VRAPTTDGASLALYLHWPFCLAKCPYCDFNSHVRPAVDEARFRDALLRELAHEAARAGPRTLTSIFFGGGTPSLMAPATVAALIDAATTHFTAAPEIEITLEANPTSVEVERLAGYRAAGVNRVSLGVQALNPDALRFLGRQHDVAQALAALAAARKIFPRVSFDLIYARPGQTVAAWQAEIARALALGPDHLSLYQLTIEPGTQFATQHARGDFALPEGDAAAALYEATEAATLAHGLARYEVSNYARAGFESRHNLAYWRYEDYLGIGPGAHQRLTVCGEGSHPHPVPLPQGEGQGEGAANHPPGTLLATRRHRAPEIWAQRVEQHGHGATDETPIAPPDRAREALLMGMRLAEGIDAARFESRTGIPLAAAIDPAMLAACIDEGYLVATPGRLAATPSGLVRLDAILPRLVR
jgi:oxygen-independent coproporphyrinogen-3 oxidase